ncbi:cytochrome P450 [Apiospora sp. TS-2023a]
MLAGADTTAIAIKSVIYYTLQPPRVWWKVVASVRNTFPSDSSDSINTRENGGWGPDACEFRPERWVRCRRSGFNSNEEETREEEETEEAYMTGLWAMNSADVTLGAGSRMCLREHLGLLHVIQGGGNLGVVV